MQILLNYVIDSWSSENVTTCKILKTLIYSQSFNIQRLVLKLSSIFHLYGFVKLFSSLSLNTAIITVEIIIPSLRYVCVCAITCK